MRGWYLGVWGISFKASLRPSSGLQGIAGQRHRLGVFPSGEQTILSPLQQQEEILIPLIPLIQVCQHFTEAERHRILLLTTSGIYLQF